MLSVDNDVNVSSGTINSDIDVVDLVNGQGSGVVNRVVNVLGVRDGDMEFLMWRNENSNDSITNLNNVLVGVGQSENISPSSDLSEVSER